MQRPTNGFTLIELMVVLVIIGLLAGVGIPRFMGAQRRAFISTLTADLRNLAVHQQLYYEETANAFTYAPNLAAMPGFRASERVDITIVEVAQQGWSARAEHGGMPGVECVVYHGDAAPITTTAGTAPGGPGNIGCDRT